MDKSKVYEVLSSHYPGKRILFLPENNPAEILCELDNDGETSTAIAVIDRSVQHYHRLTVETYLVLKGTLTIYLDGVKHTLQEGETLVIQPNILHWAEGEAVWVKVECTPPWTPGDHILSPVNT